MPKGRKVTQANGVYDGEDRTKLDDLDLLAWGLLATLKSGSVSQTRDQQSQIAKSNVAVARVGASHYVVACNGVKENAYEISSPTRSNPNMNLQDLATRADVVDRKENVENPGADLVGEIQKQGRKLYYVIHRRKGDGVFIKQVFAPRDYSFTPKDHIASFMKRMLKEAGTPLPPATGITLLTPTESFDAHGEMRILAYCRERKLPLSFIGVCKPCCEKCAETLDKEEVGYARWAPLAQQLEHFPISPRHSPRL